MISDNRYSLGIFLQCSLTLLWNVVHVCIKVSLSCQIKHKKKHNYLATQLSQLSLQRYSHIFTLLLLCWVWFQFVYNTTRVSWVSNFGDRRPRRGLRHSTRDRDGDPDTDTYAVTNSILKMYLCVFLYLCVYLYYSCNNCKRGSSSFPNKANPVEATKVTLGMLVIQSVGQQVDDIIPTPLLPPSLY